MRKTILLSTIALLLICAAGCTSDNYTAKDIPTLWAAQEPIFFAGQPDTFDEVAVKDPSIVYHDGKWHLFYTARSQSQYTMGYVTAETLDQLKTAKRHQITQMHGIKNDYAAAPQVFYFEPQKTWYLIYQTKDSNYQPVYSTTKTIDDPASWSKPSNLAAKDEKSKWIDFWVICDDELAYLFYSRGRKDLFVKITTQADFPNGFGDGMPIFAPVPKPLSEAVHIYKVKGKDQYHMLFETYDKDLRRFGLAKADKLLGPWTRVTDDYANGAMLYHPVSIEKWTEEVSHGEMIRTGINQKLEYDASKPQFLMQSMLKEQHKGSYEKLQWKLGIIKGY